jgi:hypothetical protein
MPGINYSELAVIIRFHELINRPAGSQLCPSPLNLIKVDEEVKATVPAEGMHIRRAASRTGTSQGDALRRYNGKSKTRLEQEGLRLGQGHSRALVV